MLICDAARRPLLHGIPHGASVAAFLAGYDDLPALRSLGGGTADRNLSDLPPFECAVLGWTSLSHIRSDERRVRTLTLLKQFVLGPILVSAFPAHVAPCRPRRRVEQFGMNIGAYHPMTTEDLAAIASVADFRVLHLDAGERDGGWLHAVISAR